MREPSNLPPGVSDADIERQANGDGNGLDLTEWSRRIHQNAVEHGWWQSERNFGEVCALIHSEVSEAFEEYRKGHNVDQIWTVDDKPEGIPIELADVLIRVLDFCGRHGIDIENAVQVKHDFNKTRPYRHGNLKA